MKSFAYLFQLIKNGHLDDKTVLMIDEPEVHLHPQWVVVFARLLILIRKSLGVKIVLASHNPIFNSFNIALERIQQYGDTDF